MPHSHAAHGHRSGAAVANRQRRLRRRPDPHAAERQIAGQAEYARGGGWLKAERDDFEVVRRQRAERRIQDAVVPARVEGAADVHVRAVVGDDQAVALHRAEDLLHLRREAREVACSPSAAGARPSAARRRSSRRGATRDRRSRWSRARSRERRARSRPAPNDLVVADQARAESPGRRRRRTSSRPAAGRSRSGRRTRRTGAPLRAVVEHVVELVQVPVVAIDDQQVAVGVAARSTLPGSPPSIQCACVIASSGIG